MSKTHFKIVGVDYRDHGQSEFDHSHQSACGYARDKVSTNGDYVDCFYCLRSEAMKHYHRINQAGTDSSGCV